MTTLTHLRSRASTARAAPSFSVASCGWVVAARQPTLMQRAQAGALSRTSSNRQFTPLVTWVEKRVSDPCFCNPTQILWRAV
jgi:hypothetical protein